jgi:hypothetical protein
MGLIVYITAVVESQLKIDPKTSQKADTRAKENKEEKIEHIATS